MLAAGCGAPPEARPAELWLGGDVHLGEGTPALFAAGPRELAGALGVVNLEGPVVSRPQPSSAERLVNAAPSLRALVRSGVGVATLANNHARDAGEPGVTATVRAVRAAGLTPVGGRAGFAVLALGDRRVAIASFDLAGGVSSDLAGRLRRARRSADDLVVTLHVVAPPLYLPTRTLRRAVALALASGARVVAAHGTHTVAPVERRAGAVVAWGLGNLVFRCACSREPDGLLLRVSLGRGRPRAAVLPLRAGLGGRPARLSPDVDADLALLRALGSAPLRRHGAGGWL